MLSCHDEKSSGHWQKPNNKKSQNPKPKIPRLQGIFKLGHHICQKNKIILYIKHLPLLCQNPE